MPHAMLSVPLTAASGPALRSQLRLDGRLLADLLEDSSWRQLADAVESSEASARHAPLVLFARDGRTFEAELARHADAVAVELHDISRHVADTDRFARLALQLHRRNHDLETLYTVTARLGQTLDPVALVQTAAQALGDYLQPEAVVVEAAGHVARWGGPRAASQRAGETERALRTARGPLGSVTWWRGKPLTVDEERVIDVLVHKAAISIDHALLLMPPPAEHDHDEVGLLTGPAGRRALAGFVRPFAVALVAPASADPAALATLAAAVRPGRAGDVKSRWGPDRILVALAGVGTAELNAWLTRTAPDALAAVAQVEDDIDAAIQTCAQTLDRN